MNRRQFLAASAALAAATRTGVVRAATPARPLVAATARTHLLGAGAPQTDVWAYDGRVPGPVIRARVGERLAFAFRNELPQPTTVHWHGLRVPNAMDGVPDSTQAPVPAGGRFDYAFEARNPGTYWYHPHFRTGEQLDRGLHGVIVVEEPSPPEVDREIVWVLDDWRLDGEARIVENFANLHDASHAGRFGNTATINGRVPTDLAVRTNERIRLRLVNVANAWIFALAFAGHDVRIVAYDGHGVEPHAPPGGRVVIGPSQRVDLIIDMPGRPGERFEVTDHANPRQAFKVLDLAYTSEPARPAPPMAPLAIASPALPAPDLARAETHEVTFTGGAMGGMRSALYRGEQTGIRDLARAGKVWAVNGVVSASHRDNARVALRLGKTHLLTFVNDTAFAHPVHLHGHPMRIQDVDGRAPPRETWRDTLLLGRGTRATVAFVADNPGLWMLHCHIPEHQAAGMMAVVEVG